MTHGQLGTVMISALLVAGFSGSTQVRASFETTAQSTKPVVVMAITVPKKGVPPLQLTTHEGEEVTLSVDGVGQIGFEPNFRKNSDSTVVVTIFDLASSPKHKLGETEVSVAGKPVQSKTTPSFGIQIVKVTQPK